MVTRGTRGTRNIEERWQSSKERAARALISDPDLFFFFAFLSSNKARRLAIDLSDMLGQMIMAVEGRRLTQIAVPVEASSGLRQMSGILSTVVRGGTTPSDELIAQLKREADAYTKGYLLPNVKTGGRLQPKGAEAASAYATAKKEVFAGWPRMFTYVRSLRARNPLALALTKPAALRMPSTSVQGTAGIEFPPDQASEYTLQLLASIAAVEAMSRPIDPFVRVRTTAEGSFPVTGVTVQEAGSSAGFVTAFRVVSADGSTVDPRKLGIRPKDLVRWLSSPAEVSAVGAETVLLTNSEIPVGTKTLVEVSSAAGQAYKEMRTRIDGHLQEIPTTTVLTNAISSLETVDVPTTVKLISMLAQAANTLHPLGEEPIKTATRVGATVEENSTPLSDTLLAYSPVFSARTKAAGRDLLDSLQADGFDLAAQYLLQGSIEEFMVLTAQTASFSGKFDFAANFLPDAITTQVPPGVSSR